MSSNVQPHTEDSAPSLNFRADSQAWLLALEATEEVYRGVGSGEDALDALVLARNYNACAQALDACEALVTPERGHLLEYQRRLLREKRAAGAENAKLREALEGHADDEVWWQSRVSFRLAELRRALAALAGRLA